VRLWAQGAIYRLPANPYPCPLKMSFVGFFMPSVDQKQFPFSRNNGGKDDIGKNRLLISRENS